MGANRDGGIKTRDIVYAKYGRDYYKKLGALGGAKKVPKGFALMTPEKRSKAGIKGGRISRRGSRQVEQPKKKFFGLF